MAIARISTVTTPAANYDLTTLSNVKLDLGIAAGVVLSTSQDTPNGQVLPFLSTVGAAVKQQVGGVNIPAGAIVSLVGANTVTISAAVTGDVPAGSAVTFGADILLDTFLTRAITLASAAIQKHCNNPIVVESLTDVIWLTRFDPPCRTTGGPRSLRLARWPLISVASVTTSDDEGVVATLVQGVDFVVQPKIGSLIRLDAVTGREIAWDPMETTVSYSAGYATLPSDVDDACVRMVKKSYWARGRDPTVIEQSQGSMGSTRFWVSTGTEGNLPPEIADLIDSYRVPVVA